MKTDERNRARALRAGRHYARERGPDYAAGCALFWAEGSRDRNTVKLTNSDPELVATFLRFLRTHFGVQSEEVSIRCNLFADDAAEQKRIEEFWLARLGLEQASLRSSSVNVYSKYSKRKRTKKLPYGTCALMVHSTRIAQILYGSIQELGGFDRPAWLR